MIIWEKPSRTTKETTCYMLESRDTKSKATNWFKLYSNWPQTTIRHQIIHIQSCSFSVISFLDNSVNSVHTNRAWFQIHTIFPSIHCFFFNHLLWKKEKVIYFQKWLSRILFMSSETCQKTHLWTPTSHIHKSFTLFPSSFLKKDEKVICFQEDNRVLFIRSEACMKTFIVPAFFKSQIEKIYNKAPSLCPIK